MRLLARYLSVLSILAVGGFFLGVGLAQVSPGPPILENHGTSLGAYKFFNCGQGTTCTLSGAIASISSTAGTGTVAGVTASTPINSSGGTNPNISATTSGNAGTLATASGPFTSSTCVQFDAASNVVSTGSACGGSGNVTAVSGTSPINSSGGTNPTISLITPLSVQFGGTSLSALPNALLQGQGTNAPIAYGGSGPCGAGTFATTLNASGSLTCGSAVTAVTASSPINSSGGGIPNLSLITPLSKAFGGTSDSTVVNALVLGGGSGLFSAYGGSSCTNQAATSTNASGSLSCSSITSAFMSGAASTVFMGLGGGSASVVVVPACGDVGGQHLNYASGGLITCGTTGSGGAGSTRVDQLLAATASNTITWSGNIPQIWGMGTTTDNTVMFNMSESIISSGGTSTNGFPNQVLLKLNTLAASTMSPLCVSSRTVTVFCVGNANPQLVLANGTANVPTLVFAADAPNSGLYWNTAASSWRFARLGTDWLSFSQNQILAPTGSAATPGLSDIGSNTSGLFFSNTSVGISTNARENAQFIGNGGLNYLLQLSNAGANSTGYAINARKARGTVLAPTVITIGDVGLTLSTFYYVGSVNTYVEGTRIQSTSAGTGTVGDSSTGIGANLSFYTSVSGSAIAEMARMDNVAHMNYLQGAPASNPVVNAGCGTNPTVTGNDNVFVLFAGNTSWGSCTVGFAKQWTNTPHCVVNSEATASTVILAQPTVASVVLVGSGGIASGTKVDVLCRGHL